jgi:hypothetical protein
MKKEKILELLGQVVITGIMVAVGLLVVTTAGTMLYQMIRAIFD